MSTQNWEPVPQERLQDGSLAPYVVAQEGSWKGAIFVNPKKNIQKTIFGSNGIILDFPGVENMELLRHDCSGVSISISNDVEFQLLENQRTRMIWEAQPEGEPVIDAAGYTIRRGRQIKLYSELDDEGRYLFPFRIYSVGDRLYFGTDMEEREKQAFLRKKANPERYGIDGLTVSDLTEDWMLEAVKKLRAQAETWPTELETPVFRHPQWVGLRIEATPYRGPDQWALNVFAYMGPDAEIEMSMILANGSKEELLTFLAEQEKARASMPLSRVNSLCERVKEKRRH